MTAPAPDTTAPAPHVIILAGGSGTRLWPLSRHARPKFLLDLGGSGTLLAETIRRALAITDPARVHLVSGVEHADAVTAAAAAFGIDSFCFEPSPRDTTAAITLAVLQVVATDPAAFIVSLPADHHIEDPGGAGWTRTIGHALAAAGSEGQIVTIGVRPTYASTGYGYISAESAVPGRPSRRVLAFHEKPDAGTAAGYLASGRYVWNTAIMAFAGQSFLEQLRVTAPDIVASVSRALSSDAAVDAVAWAGTRSIAIEHSLMEPAAAAGRVSVVDGDFGWTDVGTWSAVAEIGLMDQADDHVVAIAAERPFVVVGPDAGDRRFAVLGIDDLVVVDTGEVVLITTARHANDVKELVDRVDARGWKDLL